MSAAVWRFDIDSAVGHTVPLYLLDVDMLLKQQEKTGGLEKTPDASELGPQALTATGIPKPHGG